MIQFEARGFVGLATIDRQERRNALNGELCDELRGTSTSHRELRAVVITGAGSAFCAGADLVTRFAGATATDGQSTRSGPRSRRCSTRSSTIPRP